ncbi:hypothetical protein MNBD_ACTINO01-169 [hydrothermal vent metagenome]|uniref:Uncharacterized protein n=1 Tax=hydrothermal vent metagenome TaxID=652676 RepID=A0A3B0SC99_9ZZZZ
MEVSACPACGTDDIRLEVTEVTSHKIVNWRSADDRPVFVAGKDVIESETSQRVVCVNGHAHPDRIGFDLEWAGASADSR